MTSTSPGAHPPRPSKVGSSLRVGPMTVEPSAPIAVVGFGTMGAGIGHLAAGAGHLVLAYDASEGVVDRGIEAVRIRLDRSVEKGRLTVEEAHAILNRITPCASLQDLAPAWLVIEAVVEDFDAKRSVFAQLEEIVDDDCILATNTSSLSVTSLAAGLRRPERIVGMHFFYPAPVMPLVEVVSGLTTNPEVADTVFRTAQAWDKTPVHTSSTPGFIVNRVARPFYGEALRLLTEGAADVVTIDAVFREGGGFRMGPFELLDLIGIDVSLAVGESVYEATNFDPRFAPSPIQQELVRAGRFGRKTGQGFYSHEAGIETAHPQTVPPQTRPQSLVAVGDLGMFEPLVDEAARAGIPIERTRAHRHSALLRRRHPIGAYLRCPGDRACRGPSDRRGDIRPCARLRWAGPYRRRRRRPDTARCTRVGRRPVPGDRQGCVRRRRCPRLDRDADGGDAHQHRL